MSMTAQRWWVKLAARWLARVDGVSGQLRLAMLGLTGISTATISLRQYGHGEYAWPMIGIIGAGTVAYTYLYTEGGVWNQMARDRQDMSANFTRPRDRMTRIMGAMVMWHAFHERPPTEEEQEELIQTVDLWWREFRDGMQVEDAISEEELFSEVWGDNA